MCGETNFLSEKTPTCPESLLKKVNRKRLVRLAIACACSEIPMLSAYEGFKSGIITPIFIGNKKRINKIALQLKWDISPFQIYDEKHESISAEVASELCGAGEADVLMKGHLHTDVFMKAVLNDKSKLKTNSRLVHLFYITPPNNGKPVIISDAAVNISPSIETRKTSTIKSVELLRKLGVKYPKIAFLSASESIIKSMPSSVEAKEISIWAKKTIKDAHFSGPLALDLIFSKEAGKIKGLNKDIVVGSADAVIVPEIVSGNTLFKSLVYFSGGCAAGIVLGAKVPILLTSRADPIAARLASIAIASIYVNS